MNTFHTHYLKSVVCFAKIYINKHHFRIPRDASLKLNPFERQNRRREVKFLPLFQPHLGAQNDPGCHNFSPNKQPDVSICFDCDYVFDKRREIEKRRAVWSKTKSRNHPRSKGVLGQEGRGKKKKIRQPTRTTRRVGTK